MMSYINIIELTAFLFSEGWNSTRGPVLETVPVLVNQKSFQNTETIKTILWETYFELAAWADFQSRIYKATSRKRQYVYNTHRKAPPKHHGWRCWRAVQPPSYSTAPHPHLGWHPSLGAKCVDKWHQMEFIQLEEELAGHPLTLHRLGPVL